MMPPDIPTHTSLIMWLAQHMRTPRFGRRWLPVDLYVEVGLGKGITFNRVAPLVSQSVGVDIVLDDAVDRAPNTSLYEMSAMEFAEMFKHQQSAQPVDLMFLDCEHTEEGTRRNVLALGPLLRPHLGIMVVDGTYPKNKRWQGRKTAWRAIELSRDDPAFKNYELVTMPLSFYGLTIVRYIPDTYLDWTPRHG